MASQPTPAPKRTGTPEIAGPAYSGLMNTISFEL